MKKFLSFAFVALCTGAVALSATGCNKGKCTALGTPASAKQFDFTERNDEEYIAIKNKADGFAYRFSEAAYSFYDSDENFSVAPVSVFSALSLAAECASGETRGELLSVLNVNYSELSDNFSKLYRSLNGETKSSGGSLESVISLSNSVWINEGIQYKEECIKNLSQKYYAYSYSADFANDNGNANRAVRSFVKDKTRGLIDKDFELSPATAFTLINALYVKDIWNTYGDDLRFTDNAYTFTEKGGKTEQTKLLCGYYRLGEVQEYDEYSAYYTQTLNGYKVKFILPKAGRSVRDIYTAENLSEVNGISDYGGVDDENKTLTYTRCLFPEFKTSYDNDVTAILKEYFGVNKLFDVGACDFSALLPNAAWCEKVRHVNTLTVNKKGIEGAAVTVLPSAGAPGPGEYTQVYRDFAVDRAFAFMLTNYNNTVLFSGIVNQI